MDIPFYGKANQELNMWANAAPCPEALLLMFLMEMWKENQP